MVCVEDGLSGLKDNVEKWDCSVNERKLKTHEQNVLDL